MVREAIVRYLEGNEDVELARQGQAQIDTGGSQSLKELRRDLGLES
jgi:predicted DNA-binding protein